MTVSLIIHGETYKSMLDIFLLCDLYWGLCIVGRCEVLSRFNSFPCPPGR